jgi:hypothetical protein
MGSRCSGAGGRREEVGGWAEAVGLGVSIIGNKFTRHMFGPRPVRVSQISKKNLSMFALHVCKKRLSQNISLVLLPP